MTGKERREQLLDVGRSLFAERGYDGTAVEEIAARAGVSKPVVYEHFGGKEGLYAVVVDREVQRLMDDFAGALSADTPRELLEQACLVLLTYVEESGDGFRILVRESPVGTERSGGFATIMSDVASQVEHIIARGVQGARLRDQGAPASTPRPWSAWSPSPASGGRTTASPSATRSPPTWSTWPGTACRSSSTSRS